MPLFCLRQRSCVMLMTVVLAFVLPGLEQAASGEAQRAEPQRAGSAGSPPAPGKPWWSDPGTTRELGLSPEQMRRLGGHFEERSRRMKAIAGEFTAELRLLNKMAAERTVDADAFSKQALRAEWLRSQLNHSRLVMQYTMRLELTADQNGKLDRLLKSRSTRRIP
jgi:hypothetical protein